MLESSATTLVARQDSGSGADDHAPGVLASAATGIVDYIERNSGDVDRIFGSAHILPDMAGSPTLKLRLSAFCRLFEESACQTGNENFGLWFGNQFQPRDLGMWGYAAVSAPTLGAALECLVGLFRYHQESSVMQWRLDGDGLARLEYQITEPSIVERRQDAELSLGMFLNVLRECCGVRWSPEEVHFEHPKPAFAKEHEAAFGAPVYFSQRTNALLFRPDDLTRPMPSRDLRLLAVMQTCLEQLGSRPSSEHLLLDRMRTAVRMRLPEGCPSLRQIAEELRAPLSVIHQDLSAAGLTYKEMVEAVRRDLAISYTRQQHLSFSEIAMLLGYSELSAFSRAFRRWTGAAPREYRAAAFNT
ncbi:MAG: AraC family transcriptional regulator [Hyphomicrobiales bacterium]|nr:AraC family transcriptional regulator [Hyphomicrobiales bacterium]